MYQYLPPRADPRLGSEGNAKEDEPFAGSAPSDAIRTRDLSDVLRVAAYTMPPKTTSPIAPIPIFAAVDISSSAGAPSVVGFFFGFDGAAPLVGAAAPLAGAADLSSAGGVAGSSGSVGVEGAPGCTPGCIGCTGCTG